MPGIAMVSTMPMMPTTTINSISVKARREPDNAWGAGARRTGVQFKNIALFADARSNREHRRKHAEQQTTHADRHDNDHRGLDQVRHDTELNAQFVLVSFGDVL